MKQVLITKNVLFMVLTILAILGIAYKTLGQHNYDNPLLAEDPYKIGVIYTYNMSALDIIYSLGGHIVNIPNYVYGQGGLGRGGNGGFNSGR